MMHALAIASMLLLQDAAPAAKPDLSPQAPAPQAAPLRPGDAAPALTIDKWVKGEPVEKFEKGRVYVVEFWATWCGPCIKGIPHLTELQRAHPEWVTIGVAAAGFLYFAKLRVPAGSINRNREWMNYDNLQRRHYKLE